MWWMFSSKAPTIPPRMAISTIIGNIVAIMLSMEFLFRGLRYLNREYRDPLTFLTVMGFVLLVVGFSFGGLRTRQTARWMIVLYSLLYGVALFVWLAKLYYPTGPEIGLRVVPLLAIQVLNLIVFIPPTEGEVGWDKVDT